MIILTKYNYKLLSVVNGQYCKQPFKIILYLFSIHKYFPQRTMGSFWSPNKFSIFLHTPPYNPFREDRGSSPGHWGSLNFKILEQPKQCLPIATCFCKFHKRITFNCNLPRPLSRFSLTFSFHIYSPVRRPWSVCEHLGDLEMRAGIGWYCYLWTLQSVNW